MTHGQPDQTSGENLDPDDPYRYGRPDTAPPPVDAPPVAAPPADGWVAYPPPPGEDDRARRYGPSPYASVPPPGQAPGAPPPPPGSQAAGGPTTRTATTALVLGLVSLPGAFFAYLDVVPVLVAVYFGLKVLNEDRPGRTNAIAGLAAAALGAIFAIIVSVQLTDAVGQCGGWSNAQDPSFQQCVQNHL